jgi:hypothetical protein
MITGGGGDRCAFWPRATREGKRGQVVMAAMSGIQGNGSQGHDLVDEPNYQLGNV